MKIVIGICIGFANVSAALQLLVVWNFEYISYWSDSRMISFSIFVVFAHTFVNLTEYSYMFTGNASFLTAGPWALFYLGEPILTNLSKDPPFPGFDILVLVSCLIQIFVFLAKAANKVRHASYMEELQRVLVENVFNIHGLLASILGGAIWAFTILYHSSASAADAPQTYVVRNIVMLTIGCSFPYWGSFPLRFAKRKLFNAGSEGPWLHCRQKESREISKMRRAYFQNNCN